MVAKQFILNRSYSQAQETKARIQNLRKAKRIKHSNKGRENCYPSRTLDATKRTIR